MYVNSGNMSIHIIETKGELTIKDPMKRKVTKQMLHKITDKLNGGIFQYNQSTSSSGNMNTINV